MLCLLRLFLPKCNWTTRAGILKKNVHYTSLLWPIVHGSWYDTRKSYTSLTATALKLKFMIDQLATIPHTGLFISYRQCKIKLCLQLNRRQTAATRRPSSWHGMAQATVTNTWGPRIFINACFRAIHCKLNNNYYLQVVGTNCMSSSPIHWM